MGYSPASGLASLNRRRLLRLLGVSGASIGALSVLAACSSAAPAAPTAAPAAPTAASAPTTAAPPATAAPQGASKAWEIQHWHSLTASDGEIWKQTLDNFNTANKDKGVQIKYLLVSADLNTKITGAYAAGTPPDFGWEDAGTQKNWSDLGLIETLDDLAKGVNFDLTDFTPGSLDRCKIAGKLTMIPMDGSCLQMLINTGHAKEVGLDVAKPPATGDDMLTWAQKMTKREGDKVTRSGFLMTGSAVQVNVVWGIVGHQMGMQRTSPDFKTATINSESAAKAAQYILDLFDKHKVSTRDVADRYKAFGTGQGSMFITGPWTLSGYVAQEGLSFETTLVPVIGDHFDSISFLSGLELYKQKDKDREPVTTSVVKWLSDNSFLWTTKGRGVTPRTSILNRSDYKTGGIDWKIRQPFVEGQEKSHIGQIPVAAAQDFEFYADSTDLIPKIMDQVWAGKAQIKDSLATLQKEMQVRLDKG